MFWSNNTSQLKVSKEAAIKILRILETQLSRDLSNFVNSVNNEHEVSGVFSSFGYWLSELEKQRQTQIDNLEFQLQSTLEKLEWSNQVIQELRSAPLHQMNIDLKAKVAYLSDRLEFIYQEKDSLQKALASEKMVRQKEVNELKTYVSTQNRIIAQQQIRLNRLLGDTSSGEALGDKN